MPSVLTLGVFDGVHRGHQFIFKKMTRRARVLRMTPVVYTFDPHPARVLVPKACPPMLTTLAQRLTLIRACGIRRIIVQRFSKKFAHLSPQQFFDRMIVRKLRAREVFVGYDFTFGYHRSGTVELLEALGKKAGVRVRVVDPYLWKETLVSSTQVRQQLAQGCLPEAISLLGHPYRIVGKIIRGRGIGGDLLGIHTANLKPENDPILPNGVYASQTIVGEKRYASVTNIGPNPTFGPSPVSVETHLLHFHRQIVGKRISVEFVKKIREEIQFASPRDLSRQIQNDIRVARKILSRKGL